MRNCMNLRMRAEVRFGSQVYEDVLKRNGLPCCHNVAVRQFLCAGRLWLQDYMTACLVRCLVFGWLCIRGICYNKWKEAVW